MKRKGTLRSKTNDPLHIPMTKPVDSVKAGYLLKRGKINSDWKKRYFILSHEYLYYFKAPSDQKCTGVIQLLFSSFRKATSEPETKGVKACFKIITPSRIFFLGADSTLEIESWIEALTTVCAKLWEEENKLAKLGGIDLKSDIIKEGWLLKQGNNVIKDWKPRWFILKPEFVAYYTNSDDLTPLGTISLLQCSVKSSMTVKKTFCIEFITPSRTFYAAAKDQEEMNSWMEALKTTIMKNLDYFFENNNSSRKGSGFGVNGSQPLNIAPPDNKLTTGSSSSSYGSNYTNAPIGESLVPQIAQMLQQPENKVCAECGTPDPKWASINLGIFICIECSGIHRSLGVHLSKVRSIDLDVWDPETLEFITSMGNKKAKEIWEYHVSPQWEAKRPTPNSDRTVKAYWIHAKYVDKRFADPDIILQLTIDEIDPNATKKKEAIPSSAPFREGFLTKQGPKEELIKSWKKRWFILKENYMYYYTSREDPIPIGLIKLGGAKVRVPTSPTGRNHCFEISTPQRDWIISADDSSEMTLWMTAIRESIEYWNSQEPKSVKVSLSDDTTKRRTIQLKESEIKKKGILYKQGNNVLRDWKSRWVVLYKRCLYYYESEESTLPLGIIELEPNCTIVNSKNKPKKHFLDLITPTRTYYFYAENMSDMKDWIELIRQITMGKATQYKPIPTPSALVSKSQSPQITPSSPSSLSLPKFF